MTVKPNFLFFELAVPPEAWLIAAAILGAILALVLVNIVRKQTRAKRMRRAAALIQHLLSTDRGDIKLNHLYHDPEDKRLKGNQGGDNIEIVHPALTASTNPAALGFAGFEQHETIGGMRLVAKTAGYETVSWVTKDGGVLHKLLRRRRERDVKATEKKPASTSAIAPVA